MGRQAGWLTELTGRSPMKSPGRPSTRREVERLFWREIAKGLTSEDAAVAGGACPGGGQPVVPARWRDAADRSWPSRAGTCRLPSARRSRCCKAQGTGVREIAQQLGRAPVDDLAGAAPQRRHPRRQARVPGLGRAVEGRPAGPAARSRRSWPATRGCGSTSRTGCWAASERPDGTVRRRAADACMEGANKPHRGDRRWATAWSPEQICARLKIDFPDDESMRISHEAIYQALYIEGRGALKRELVACLRTGRALRVPRARSRNKPQAATSPPDVVISERPAEAEDRAVPGHWEGDLIIGLNRSAIGTLVERTTRYTHAGSPAPRGGLRHHPADQERPGAGRLRRHHDEGRPRHHDDHAARPAAPVTDLGPRQGAVRARPVQGRDRACPSTSPTRTLPGSAARTRTPTGCCASTSPRAPTCRDGPPTNSPPSPRPSTPAPARPSAGRHPPKPSTSIYDRCTAGVATTS